MFSPPGGRIRGRKLHILQKILISYTFKISFLRLGGQWGLPPLMDAYLDHFRADLRGADSTRVALKSSSM